MCPLCHGKRKSYCVYCRFKQYVRERNRYAPRQRDILEWYRNRAILKAIDDATQADAFDGLETFEQIKEAFSFELIVKWKDEILSRGTSEKRIYFRAKKYTNRRKATWHVILIRQKEAIQARSEEHVLEFDEEGHIADFGPPPVCGLPFRLPDIYKTNPEQFLERLQFYLEIHKLPAALASMQRKWAQAYARIIEVQLSGDNLSSHHFEMLGIENKKQLREIKCQALDAAMKHMAKIFPELEESQRSYKANRGRKRKPKKSTFTERKALHRTLYRERSASRLIRNWNVLKGRKQTNSENTHYPFTKEVDDGVR